MKQYHYKQPNKALVSFINLWAAWVFVTLLDIAIYIASVIVAQAYHAHPGTYVRWFSLARNLVGLFVPYGLNDFSISFASPLLSETGLRNICALVLLLSVLFAGNHLGQKYIFRIQFRILLNALILFLLTAAIDLILWNTWTSWFKYTTS